jgi:pectate lyase
VAPSPSPTASTLASPTPSPTAAPRDLGREVLAANDGWASATTGTTGGAKADARHVFTVADHKQLVAALGDPTDAAPRIVRISGTIDGNVDDADRPLRCDEYATGGYTLERYLAAYDPATWGRTKRPSGPQEEARAASQKKQAARVQFRVGPNTTIVGLPGARLVGVDLVLDQVDNVIIRNLSLVDAHDCFPQWDPTDGAQGNWNSQYDNISINGATHVWIDHCAFTDGDRPDAKQPMYFGRPYQVHDGQIDIAKAADLITVSWDRFSDHDKTMLIGSSDTATADGGKLNVTLHHNLFDGVGQRAPRVRFGKVDVYNNLYDVRGSGYTYSWGVGVDSKLHAESNVVHLAADIAPDRFVRVFGGKAASEVRTLLVIGGRTTVASMVAAYNGPRTEKLGDDVAWSPTLRPAVDHVDDVAALVTEGAGPLR